MIFLAELQGRIDKGELSPDGALAQSLEAIATYEKAIGAFASLAEAPCAQKTGRLRGIAVGIKDIIENLIFRPRWARRSIGGFGRAPMRPW